MIFSWLQSATSPLDASTSYTHCTFNIGHYTLYLSQSMKTVPFEFTMVAFPLSSQMVFRTGLVRPVMFSVSICCTTKLEPENYTNKLLTS